MAVPVLIFIFISPVSSAVVEGIVIAEKGPVENPQVFAYPSYMDLMNNAPSHTSGAGKKTGFFRLELPPGKYYLAASGRRDGLEYFSYHGANPITIEDKKLWIPFMALLKTEAAVKDSASARISGQVTFKGEPVRDAQVSIFPASDIAFRGMGFLTGTTDNDGYFSMNPEPGRYVIVARKRKDFKGLRPLIKGDLFCYVAANPVPVEVSKTIDVEIPCYPKDDLKAFLDEDVYPTILVKKSGEDSVRFRENKIEKTSDILKIQGRVIDFAGNPMKDLYVMAYGGRASGMFQMLYVRTMPEYMVKTDEQGYYTIEAEKQGTYYMVARELLGEAPARGEYYGLYEGNTNHAIVLDRRDVNAADIVVSRVMAEDNELRSNRSLSGPISISTREYVGDTVIYEDTTWEGEILINGVVYVARKATLTIKPGTSVKFRKIDKNRDGVGDGKIRVSGKLVAAGTPESMILFTSAEEEPTKMDWSYLLFFASGSENIVKYCVFGYAFTGVQVHFSKALITDSVFTGNHEAIRFGRTELRVEHNDIISNNYGIRYTRLEGPVKITSNNIWNNDVGIFHVPSNQNIVDFSDTFDKKEMLHRHQPVVRFNNIAYNEEYNFRLGERQGYNMLLKDNWWGSIKEEVIHDDIYDESTDSTLGKVIYKPYLNAPVKDAGVRRGGMK